MFWDVRKCHGQQVPGEGYSITGLQMLWGRGLARGILDVDDAMLHYGLQLSRCTKKVEAGLVYTIPYSGKFL